MANHTVKLRKKARSKPKAATRTKEIFFNRVKNDLKRALPVAPYKIGVKKDLFELLKAQYEGERKKLRRAIGAYLSHKTSSIAYLKAMRGAEFRHGLDGEKYALSDEDRACCAERIRLTRKSKAK